ncbi:transposase [Escherichia fergusonii]|uniref:IS4/Tn5 family transposase DNA-binding protein n=1 Tax=Escherichia fergusonii TaxID=564 RepID=UPI0022B48F8D|nr:transposase [Escherichia fergusonii]MCZ5218244.1 transposase [Escherichia fergusonii]
MENWVIQELKSLDIGDSRLDKRVKHILNSLSRSPEESIPVSCRTWSETKAAYHCFSNDKVSANKIMAPDKENIIERAGNDSNLLIVFYVQIMPDDFVMQLHRF